MTLTALQIFRGIHMMFGATVVLSGLICFLCKKGSPLHRKSGKIFVVCMGLAAAFSVAMHVADPHRFDSLPLSLIFFYLAYNGYRIIQIGTPPNFKKADISDWTILYSTLLTNLLFMVPLSVYYKDTVMFVLGCIGVYYTIEGIRWLKHPEKFLSKRLYHHVCRMIQAYSATVCALSALIFEPFLSYEVRWLWPVVAGLIIILLIRRKVITID